MIVKEGSPIVFNHESSNFEYTSIQEIHSQPLPEISDDYANHAHQLYNPKLFKQLQSSFVYEYLKDGVQLVKGNYETNYDILIGAEEPSRGIFSLRVKRRNYVIN